MKSKKNNNKNIFIIVLLILILALAVGYAAFSDILTISGTANAKGTFDLEFQNAEVVKNVGADIEKTTAVISEDKNMLTVNVADLSYPGSGVEFSVDIVNVGSIPAEVQAVTPTNTTGSEKIKVAGLDAIKTDHPKIEAGDKCNIHFTVEWPADSGEILENESNISFGLQIEYVQSTGELFEGNISHTDKNGNTVNGGETEEPTYETLISQITPGDYGKAINYKATVKGEEVSNWKLLYKDENKVYIILDDFLPNNLVPTEAGLSTSGTHVVNSGTNREVLLNGLKTTSYWSEFANGYEGAEAQGAPEFDIIMKSYNEKHNASMKTDPTISGSFTIDKTDTLYVSHDSSYNGVNVYWLAAPCPSNSNSVWYVSYGGYVNYYSNYNYSAAGVRPVVSLPSSITGTVGETIEIK